LENEKRFAIYYMLGLSNRKFALIEGIRGFIVIVFSFAAMLVLYYLPFIHNLFGLDPTTTVNGLTFTFIGLYLTLIYCVTSVGFIIKMEKSNLIDLYRNRD
jgi:Mg/Co/Ni transporter MgtE